MSTDDATVRDALGISVIVIAVLLLVLVVVQLLPESKQTIYKNAAGQYVEPYNAKWLDKHKQDRRIITLGNDRVVSIDYP